MESDVWCLLTRFDGGEQSTGSKYSMFQSWSWEGDGVMVDEVGDEWEPE